MNGWWPILIRFMDTSLPSYEGQKLYFPGSSTRGVDWEW